MPELSQLIDEALQSLGTKEAAGFIDPQTLQQLSAQQPVPPTPGMDPAAAGGPPPGGQPPVDPAMAAAGGMPMDPAMAGGAPPMDPAMAGGAPPMDPAMAGGAPPPDPMAGGGLDPGALADAIVERMQGGAGGKGKKPKQNTDDLIYKTFVLLKGLYRVLELPIPPEILDSPDGGQEGGGSSGGGDSSGGGQSSGSSSSGSSGSSGGGSEKSGGYSDEPVEFSDPLQYSQEFMEGPGQADAAEALCALFRGEDAA